MMQRFRTRFVVLAPVLAFAGCATAATTAWAATTTTKNVSVVAKSVWTPTGITVHRGDRLTVIASGKAHFGPAPIDAVPPTGVRGRPDCQQFVGRTRPAPELSCYTLIGRIGSGPIFEVGRAKTLLADRAGALQLGVNDNFFPDNSGAWTAQVVTTSTSSSSSLPVVPIALGIVALAAIAALVALVRRSRKRTKADVSEVVDRARFVPADAARGAAAVAPENDEVNIFEVELEPNGLRVGYSYFPAGTLVRWVVYSYTGASARGEFTAEGGGGTPHAVMLPFDAPLPDAEAEVRFEWNVAGVPFRYAVKRTFARH